MQRDALLSPQAPPRRRRRAAGARARSASAAGARCVRGISDRGARQRPRSEMLCRGRGATEAVRLGLRHPEPSVFLARLHVNHLSSTSRPTIAIRLRRAGSPLLQQSIIMILRGLGMTRWPLWPCSRGARSPSDWTSAGAGLRKRLSLTLGGGGERRPPCALRRHLLRGTGFRQKGCPFERVQIAGKNDGRRLSAPVRCRATTVSERTRQPQLVSPVSPRA